jgi:LysM repeat protein
MMNKKLLLAMALTLILAVSVCLGACGGGASESTSESTSESASGSVSESTSESTSESESETEIPTYTVRLLDETGAELTSLSVKAGEVPSYTYEKSDTAEWDYTVRGWAASQGGEALATLPAVTADATYYAVVTSEKQTYTVTLNTQGGTALPPLTVEYGGTVSELSKPENENFRFVGWTVDGEELTLPFTVTGNVIFVAVYNE